MRMEGSKRGRVQGEYCTREKEGEWNEVGHRRENRKRWKDGSGGRVRGLEQGY